ncbi:IS21 family transposase [Desulfosarcina variabilis]|uniref:IS21 family transposase n=1 Tax=Desulfosarcina variabilis TaxID=2300 RepID=UPI003AFA0391
MAKDRLSMRKFKEVLRLKFEHGLTNRKIAKSCAMSHVTVGKYLTLAENADITWPLPDDIDDSQLEQRLYQKVPRPDSQKPVMPQMEYLFKELKRKYVTLQLLWYEYKQDNPEGYQYSYFCELYQKWRKGLDISMRQEHLAGEKLFIDYAGQTVSIINPETGKVELEAQIFIATLGASNFSYTEATASQTLPDWIKSHIRALEFFGGVPQILVPDNLKSGVTHPCRYEPDVNPTYTDLANHYGTTVIPTRPGKPKDKAKVESSVLIVERWILAALRNHRFFSLAELNKAIYEKLMIFNQRPLQKMKASRQHLFETIDKPALAPLPAHRYEFAQWKKATVNIDYHVEVDHHYYSVPYQLRGKKLDVSSTATTVTVFHKNRRVASHLKSHRKYHYSTLPEHMPKTHQKYLEWTPSRIINWAGKTGPCTQHLVTEIMQRKKHPEQGFRSCLGVMRLGKRYSPQRLEKACERAVAIGAYTFKNVESILKNGLDQTPLIQQTKSRSISHPNIRGSRYYNKKEN